VPARLAMCTHHPDANAVGSADACCSLSVKKLTAPLRCLQVSGVAAPQGQDTDANVPRAPPQQGSRHQRRVPRRPAGGKSGSAAARAAAGRRRRPVQPEMSTERASCQCMARPLCGSHAPPRITAFLEDIMARVLGSTAALVVASMCHNSDNGKHLNVKSCSVLSASRADKNPPPCP